MRQTVASLFSLLFLLGCREGGSRAGLEYSVDTVGTVERVSIRGTPAPWSLTPLYTVGADTGAEMFGLVRSVLVDSAGALWVADAGEVRILRFGPDGAPRAALGRSGAGPGEYRDPYSIVRVGDRFAVLDPGGTRVGLFGLDDAWAGQFIAPRMTGRGDVRLYPVSADQAWMMGYRIEGQEIRRLWIAVLGTGMAGDTIAAVPSPKEGPAYHVVCKFDGGLSFFSAPFAPTSIRVPLDTRGTSVAVDESAYRLTFVGPAGDTLRIVEREVGSLAISDAEWEAGNVEYNTFRTERPSVACEPSTMDRPASKNAILGLWGSADGRLWVHARTETGEVFDVYDLNGRLLGSMSAKPVSEDAAPSAVGDRLALPWKDAEGRELVTVFRLTR